MAFELDKLSRERNEKRVPRDEAKARLKSFRESFSIYIIIIIIIVHLH